MDSMSVGKNKIEEIGVAQRGSVWQLVRMDSPSGPKRRGIFRSYSVGTKVSAQRQPQARHQIGARK
jgi:hypothetical protein